MNNTVAEFRECVLSSEDHQLADKLVEKILLIGPHNFIVHVFNHFNGAAVMTRCFLLLFRFWKDFSVSEWQNIFNKLTDLHSGQYYLSYNFRSFLNVDPRFGEYTEKQLPAADEKDQNEFSVKIVHESDHLMKKLRENQIREYGITLADFQKISSRLLEQGATPVK